MDFVCQDWGNMLIDLEFYDQIHTITHELIRITQSCGSVITIVEHNQVNTGGRRGSLKTVGYGLGERHVGGFTAKPESCLFGARHQPVKAVLRLRQIAAMNKSFQDAIDG